MQVFLIVVPVFALVAIGFLAARTGVFSETTHKGLSEFAFSIAMPAQLFRTTAAAGTAAFDPFALWGAYFGAIAITWALAAALTHYVLKRPPADGASIAMSAVYGNVVMIGLPLSVAAFGETALVPVALILSLNTPALWLAGTLHMEWAERKPDASMLALARAMLVDLARNPLIMAILAGLVWRITGLGIYAPVEKVLDLLAQSSVPCALIALGASLTRFRVDGQVPTLTTLCVLKLIVMPALAWVLAFHVFRLPPVTAGVVVILAAMPAGANSYIFAMRYQKVVNSASGAVALGTALSAFTAAALLSALMTP